MTQDEIVAAVVTHLNSQSIPGGAIGSIYQDPYRMMIFKLFTDAYNQGFVRAGLLGADALQEKVQARWFTGEKEDDEKKVRFLDTLHACWYEWEYAWNHADMKRP